tara:strand:- start:1974 stop:2351 length:378 start_codon:yes stop_codon:yes gene_type:complete
MLYNIKGVLLEKRDSVQITDKFKKQEFVLHTDDKYEQFITFFLANEKCEKISQVPEGSTLEVTFAIKGKKWEKEGQVKYFNSLEAINLEWVGSPQQTIPQAEVQPQVQQERSVGAQGESNDDIPF